MASRWGFVGANLNGWYGNGGRTLPSYRNILDPPPEPNLFRPSDISGLQGWLDANDDSTVNANEFGTVLSWSNKGDLSGNFDLSGSADVQYAVNTVNGLPVVTFTPFAYMSGTFPLNFQDRSIFIVTRRTADVSGGVLAFWTSDTTGGMETAVTKSGSDYTYLLAKHPGSGVELAFTTQINTTGGAELVTLINSSTDLSDNYVGLNGEEQTIVFGALADYNTASFPYYIGNYGNGVPLDNTYDMCEVLVYNSVLTADQRLEVEVYLQRKWRVKVPPVPPVPFVPTDLSGLQVWLDGANTGSLSLSNTMFPVPQDEVLSWSNVGSAGGLFSLTTGTPTYTSSIVSMPSGAALDAYFALPYLSRSFFAVVECVSDLSTAGYPFLVIQDALATDGRQIALTYDSNVPTFRFQVCQSGTNCPLDAPFNPMPSGLFLVTGLIDQSNSSTTEAYINKSSNLNISTDLGNQFNQNPIPYVIGSSNAGPDFRIGEFLEYDTLLSSGDVSTVTAYLSDKWGLGL
jgi:hypothetical protein